MDHKLPPKTSLGAFKAIKILQSVFSGQSEIQLEINTIKFLEKCPPWCGSVDWALACEPKGHRFDSQSGHMPGLQAKSPVGDGQEATTH